MYRVTHVNPYMGELEAIYRTFTLGQVQAHARRLTALGALAVTIYQWDGQGWVAAGRDG